MRRTNVSRVLAPIVKDVAQQTVRSHADEIETSSCSRQCAGDSRLVERGLRRAGSARLGPHARRGQHERHLLAERCVRRRHARDAREGRAFGSTRSRACCARSRRCAPPLPRNRAEQARLRGKDFRAARTRSCASGCVECLYGAGTTTARFDDTILSRTSQRLSSIASSSSPSSVATRITRPCEPSAGTTYFRAKSSRARPLHSTPITWMIIGFTGSQRVECSVPEILRTLIVASARSATGSRAPVSGE